MSSEFMDLRQAPSTVDAFVQRGAPELSVVVPVHDEAENIAPLVAEIHAALDGPVDSEIVVVDDASADATRSAWPTCSVSIGASCENHGCERWRRKTLACRGCSRAYWRRRKG